jgi:hypothetical protein
MENWKPAREAWATFCKNNPGLGLNGSKNSFIWFVRTHAEQLRTAGHMRKTVNRRWLASVESFDAAAFDLLTGVSK